MDDPEFIPDTAEDEEMFPPEWTPEEDAALDRLRRFVRRFDGQFELGAAYYADGEVRHAVRALIRTNALTGHLPGCSPAESWSQMYQELSVLDLLHWKRV